MGGRGPRPGMFMPPMGPGGMMAPPPMMAPPGAMPPHMAGGRTFGPRGAGLVPIVSTSRPGPTTLPVIILAGPCKTFTSLPKMQGGVHQAACPSNFLMQWWRCPRVVQAPRLTCCSSILQTRPEQQRLFRWSWRPRGSRQRPCWPCTPCRRPRPRSCAPSWRRTGWLSGELT